MGMFKTSFGEEVFKRKYAQNEHEMIELFRELLKQMTEDILIERLSEATE